jgi:hypothetical protein
MISREKGVSPDIAGFGRSSESVITRRKLIGEKLRNMRRSNQPEDLTISHPTRLDVNTTGRVIIDEQGNLDRRGFLTLAAAAATGAAASKYGPSLWRKFFGDTYSSETVVTPEENTVVPEMLSELGFLQLLQRDMSGDFRLKAKDRYKLDLPGERFDVQYDPPSWLKGQEKHFTSKGEAYTVINFRDIKILRSVNGRGDEEVDVVLPEVRIGGVKVSKIHEIAKDTKNGYFDYAMQRGNFSDKIKVDPVFDTAQNDFSRFALTQDEELLRLSRDFAKKVIAEFENKHGFKVTRVRFEDPTQPYLESVLKELPDGIQVLNNVVNPDGTVHEMEPIEAMITRANARIEENKKVNGGKYVPPKPHLDSRAAIEAEGHQP